MPLLNEARDALADLRAAFEADAGAGVGSHVFLYADKGRGQDTRWQRLSLGPSLAEQFTESARLAITELQAKAGEALAEFDFDSMASGEVGVLRLVEAGTISQWLNQVPTADWHVRFSGDQQFLDKVKFYATRVSFPDGRELKSFRGKRGLRLVLAHERGVMATLRRDIGEMQVIDSEVVIFDQEIDFFEWQDFIFIASLSSFEALTNIRELTVSKARQALDALSTKFMICDLDDLKTAIGKKTTLSKKLAAALQHGLADHIDGDALLARIAERALSFKCEKIGERFHITVDQDDSFQVTDFVNVVTDVFLQSPVTRREWNAIVKRPATAGRRSKST